MPRDPKEYRPVTLEQLAAGAPEVPDVPGQLSIDGSTLIASVEFSNVDPEVVALVTGGWCTTPRFTEAAPPAAMQGHDARTA